MMTRVFPITAALSLLFVACTPKTPTYSIQHAEKRVKLESNGLRAVIIPDETTELVEVDVRYEVGANEDPEGKAGLAHLVEHMMFLIRPDGEGTPPLMDYVTQISTFFNAYTIWDQTHYMTQVRKDYLDAVLKIEAMRLFYGCKTISEEEFLREREVVRNEIRQRMGEPENQVVQLVHQVVYPEGHAYHDLTGGDDEQLASITLEDACKFIEDHYVPERATLVIAGNVEFEETVDLIEKWFGRLPAKDAAPRAEVEPIDLAKKRIEKELDIPHTQVWVAWSMPPQYSDKGRYNQFIANALGGRFAGFNRDWEFATSAGAFVSGGPHAPVLLATAELESDDKLDEALEFLWKATDSAHRQFESGVFDDFKKVMKGNLITTLEPLQARTGLIADMVQFDDEVEWDSNQEFLLKQLEEIETIDGGEIRSATQEILNKDEALILVVRSKEDAEGLQERSEVEFTAKTHGDNQRDLTDVNPENAHRPIQVSTELDQMEGARRFELGNGMDVVLLPFATMPIVSAQLVFDVGSVHEDPSKAGLASIAARFLTPPMSRDPGTGEMYTVFSKVGIQRRGGAGSDHTTFSARGINIYLEPLIRGLERWLYAGEYSQKAIESYQKAMRERFERERYRDNYEFGRQLYSAVFGPNHPYTTTGQATPTSIDRLGRDAATDFKRKHYTAKNATLVVAGKFDAEQAESLIRDHFGSWDGGHQDQPVSAAPKPRSGPEYVGVVGRPLPQMRIAIAYPAPAGIDENEAARRVLQGMLNERMGDLRKELGSTYGVYARKATQVGPSMYQMGGTVDAERAGESLVAMRAGIDELRAGEGFDEAFVRARRAIVQRLLGQSTVSASVAARLAQMEKYDLPPDYYGQLLTQVATVTPAQVKEVLDNELRPELEVVVGMADRDTLEAAFSEAGLDTVKYVEPEYE